MTTDDTPREGDLVKLTRGEEVRIGRAAECGGSFLVAGVSVGVAPINGYTVKILERAPEPLPKEPGFYEDCDGDLWLVDQEGELILLTDGGLRRDPYASEVNPGNCAPFTRLVPEQKG